MGINKVMLLGNLGKDPEVKYTPQQMAICRFSLATGERKKDQSGQWVDHTEWHNVVTFGRTAENCAKFLKKGRQAFVEDVSVPISGRIKRARIVIRPRSSLMLFSSLVVVRARCRVMLISVTSHQTITFSPGFQQQMRCHA